MIFVNFLISKIYLNDWKLGFLNLNPGNNIKYPVL